MSGWIWSNENLPATQGTVLSVSGDLHGENPKKEGVYVYIIADPLCTGEEQTQYCKANRLQ